MINDIKLFPLLDQRYKTIQILEEYADYYLHITPIKKWDVCAPDAILRANHGTMTTSKIKRLIMIIEYTNFLITDGILATYKRNHNDTFEILNNIESHKIFTSKKA